MSNFIPVPGNRIIDIDKIAFIGPSTVNEGGVRISFGSQFLDFDSDVAAALIPALQAKGADTTALRAAIGLKHESPLQLEHLGGRAVTKINPTK